MFLDHTVTMTLFSSEFCS